MPKPDDWSAFGATESQLTAELTSLKRQSPLNDAESNLNPVSLARLMPKARAAVGPLSESLRRSSAAATKQNELKAELASLSEKRRESESTLRVLMSNASNGARQADERIAKLNDEWAAEQAKLTKEEQSYGDASRLLERVLRLW